jgi:hypothetical protein
MHEIRPRYQLLDDIPRPLHSPNRKNPMRFISWERGGEVRPAQFTCLEKFYSETLSLWDPVWRGSFLLKENIWFEGVLSAGLQTSKIYRANLSCSLSSIERRRVQSPHDEKGRSTSCLSPETVAAIGRWTVFLVLVLHIADGNVFAFE